MGKGGTLHLGRIWAGLAFRILGLIAFVAPGPAAFAKSDQAPYLIDHSARDIAGMGQCLHIPASVRPGYRVRRLCRGTLEAACSKSVGNGTPVPVAVDSCLRLTPSQAWKLELKVQRELERPRRLLRRDASKRAVYRVRGWTAQNRSVLHVEYIAPEPQAEAFRELECFV